MSKEIEKEFNKGSKMNTKKPLFGLKEVVGIVIITAVVGFLTGFLVKQEDTKTTLSHYEEELLSNYQYILTNYYKNVDARDLVSVAIKGMIDYLDDPYADYISSNDIDNFNLLINGEYEGIGIQISYNEENEVVITYVFPDSSADQAGLEAGDIFVKINDETVLEMSLDEIKNLISTFNDEEFNITYKRDGNEYQTKLKREKVTIESVQTKIFEKNDSKIGYIKLSNFATNSYQQFNDKLENLEKDNIDSLIIDLRDNTGGELETVENIVSLFIPKGKVIYQMKDKGQITKTYSESDTERNYPIVVLVNEYSASASELMTGALKEIYGATIIGVNTYGKGTAQKVVTLDNGERYKFTIKEWLTAKGNSIEGVGIEPTIRIEQPEKYYMDPIEENDEQLNRALELLCQ